MIKTLVTVAFQFILFFSQESLLARHADFDQDVGHDYGMLRPIQRPHHYLTVLDQQALNLGIAVKNHVIAQALTDLEAIQYRKNSGILPLTHLFMQEPTSFKALKIYEMHRDNREIYETNMMRGVFFVLFNIEHGHQPLAGLEEDAPLFMQEIRTKQLNPLDIRQIRDAAAAA